MSNSINNKLLNTQSNNRSAQVFDINLDPDLISSLQESIDSLNQNLNQNQNPNLNLNPNDESQNLDLNSSTNVTNQTLVSTIPSNQTRRVNERRIPSKSLSNNSPITNRNNSRPNYEGQSKRLYSKSADISVKDPALSTPLVPKIQVPFFERFPIGSNNISADGTSVETTKNKDGTITEKIISSNGSTITKTYQDFPADKNGNSTGFRTTIVDNNYNVTILSTVINDLGGGNFSTVTTNLTDQSNPIHIMSSALRKTSNVVDDDGNLLYNSNSSLTNNVQQSVTHEKLGFEDVDSLRRPSGYKSTYNTTNPDGSTSRLVTETISYTNEDGKRITQIFDITDSNDPVEISRTTRDDPFVTKKPNGTLITNQLNKVNGWGLLDITGDGNLDPLSDLLLIARYLKGFRGSELTHDINLGENPKPISELEENISKVLNRGLLDIVGSQTETNKEDLKILARYIMGARGEVLLDKKLASDDSIKINNDGSNVLSLDEENPILGEIQEIFGVSGKRIEFNNANGQKQNYRLFFVNTTN